MCRKVFEVGKPVYLSETEPIVDSLDCMELSVKHVDGCYLDLWCSGQHSPEEFEHKHWRIDLAPDIVVFKIMRDSLKHFVRREDLPIRHLTMRDLTEEQRASYCRGRFSFLRSDLSEEVTATMLEERLNIRRRRRSLIVNLIWRCGPKIDSPKARAKT